MCWLLQHAEPASSCFRQSLSVVVAVMLGVTFRCLCGPLGNLWKNGCHACCGSSLFIVVGFLEIKK